MLHHENNCADQEYRHGRQMHHSSNIAAPNGVDVIVKRKRNRQYQEEYIRVLKYFFIRRKGHQHHDSKTSEQDFHESIKFDIVFPDSQQ